MDMINSCHKDDKYNNIMDSIRDKTFNFDIIQSILPQVYGMLEDLSCDRRKLRNILQNIGHSVFCRRFDHPQGGICRSLCFDGSHDYNVALVRCLDEARPFYIRWLKSMEPYLESDGEIYPRYVPVIHIRDGQHFVSESVLLTKKDIPGLGQCILPKYYNIPDSNMKYGTLDDQERLYRKYLGSAWKEAFERFREYEWPVCRELEKHPDRYKNLSETVSL